MCRKSPQHMLICLVAIVNSVHLWYKIGRSLAKMKLRLKEKTKKAILSQLCYFFSFTCTIYSRYIAFGGVQ